MRARIIFGLLIFISIAAVANAGPFEQEGIDKDDEAIVAWAAGYENYLPAGDVDSAWKDPEKALGPATGRNVDVVSMGEPEDGSSDPPGEITLTFDVAIIDGQGADLVVFENGFYSGELLFAELAYIEVSSDGVDFARFPSVSLTPESVGPYGGIDPTDVYNLAGRHPNAYGETLGTPFDLQDLIRDPLVDSGAVDLGEINYVRIVDVPGSGDFLDHASLMGYEADHPIYDVFPTTASAGFDLEALGVINAMVTDDDDDAGDDDDDDDDAGSDGDDDDDFEGDDDDAGGTGHRDSGASMSCGS